MNFFGDSGSHRGSGRSRGSRGGWLFLLSALTCGAAATDAEAAGHAIARAETAPRSLSREPAARHAPTAAERRAALKRWLAAHTPEGTEVIESDGEPGPFTLAYTTKKGDTLASIARALLDVSRTYLAEDLASEIARANPRAGTASLTPGTRLVIPNVVDEPYATGDDARLGWPEDKQLRGLYVRGVRGAARTFPALLDRMAEHGMNAIVLDTKDTEGTLTYPSKVPLAIETGATKGAPMPDLARTIRFAHARGIRVVMRISCFHDEWMQHHKAKEMSIRGKLGGIYPIGWLDPASEVAHRYLIDLAREAMDAGADEIELDYVRYPVIGIKNADFKLDQLHKTKTEVIRDFVREVHAVTKARHVPLSLDVFGVVATGARVDIEMLGQDVAMLGPECEVLSPMVYPSHYAKGFMGFEVPGDHPELVGIGTRGTLEQLADGHVASGTLVRPWLQAMHHEAPSYSPQYLAEEVKSAREHGASGWLMWNPQQDYSFAWQAVPKVHADDAPRAVAHAAR